jgi:hypothetical protein
MQYFAAIFFLRRVTKGATNAQFNEAMQVVRGICQSLCIILFEARSWRFGALDKDQNNRELGGLC